MFQALGSNSKTKIAYVMFLTCCLFIILAIYVSKLERVEFDETFAYCATVTFSPKIGHRIRYWKQQNDFKKIPLGCARACYKEQFSQNGLAFLEIETQTGYKNRHQAFAAGMIEGSLTWMSIYAHYTNTIMAFCEANGKFCDWLREVVWSNYEVVDKIANENQKTDPFQHQVFLYYEQLRGIAHGFKKGVRRARQEIEIPFEDFFLLNAQSDIEDLKIYYNNFQAESDDDQIKIEKMLGKILLKIVPGSDDNQTHPKVLIGQSSSAHYNSMLKIVKTYRLNYHMMNHISHLVKNTDITFTTHPGVISSNDDFYLAHGKRSELVIVGLPLRHRQHSSTSKTLHGFDIQSSISSQARIMASIRLSSNGSSLLQNLKIDPNTGVKQWIVVDEKKLKYFKLELEDDENLKDFVTRKAADKSENDIPKDLQSENLRKAQTNKNVVWLIEQTFSEIHGDDVTYKLKSDDSSWVFDGSPTFNEIQQLNELYREDVRVNDREINNLDDMKNYLSSVLYRGDLQNDPELFGNVDMKIYSSNDQILQVQNGPISSNNENNLKPFDWTSHTKMDIKHLNHPNLWNFSPVKIQFFWQ